MFPHPDRDCVFEEAMVSAGMLKYRGLRLEQQVDGYRGRGIQPHAGLHACGVIARKEPLPAKLRHATEVWWAENLEWTYQDQLSLPFVLASVGDWSQSDPRQSLAQRLVRLDTPQERELKMRSV
jgi:hypothetical protein